MAVLRILIFLDSFHNVKDKTAMGFLKKAITKEYSLHIQQILIVFIMYKAKEEY